MTTRKRNLKKDLKDNAPAAVASQQKIVIDQPTVLAVTLEVSGTADLIQNRFSQKAVEQMLKSHMGHSTQRERKIPRQVLEDATVRNIDGVVSQPPTGFKLAMISAATQIKGLKKTQLRTALFVQGSSIPIQYETTMPRMDITRTSGIGRTPDVRFRPSFQNWKARMTILYADTLSVQTVVDLLNRAGQVGVGEWRPEKNGSFGTFKVTRHISDPKEIGEVEQECSVPLVALTIPSWALDCEIDPEVLGKIFSEGEQSAARAEREDEAAHPIGELKEDAA